MSSTGGYRSPLDLGLGQVPLTTDPDIFNQMTDVYNAIHLLNSYLDQLRVIAEGGGGSGQAPVDSMPFNRFYVAPALVNITIGQVISPALGSGLNGMVLGCLANNNTDTEPTSNFTGIALTAALAGEDVRVGIGPAILTMPTATPASPLFAYGSRTVSGALAGLGTLYATNPGPVTVGGSIVYPMPVATCALNGFALIGQYIARAHREFS